MLISASDVSSRVHTRKAAELLLVVACTLALAVGVVALAAPPHSHTPTLVPRHADRSVVLNANKRCASWRWQMWLLCAPTQTARPVQTASLKRRRVCSGWSVCASVRALTWNCTPGDCALWLHACCTLAHALQGRLSYRTGVHCCTVPCRSHVHHVSFGCLVYTAACSVCAEGQATLMPCSPGFDTVCEGT